MNDRRELEKRRKGSRTVPVFSLSERLRLPALAPDSAPAFRPGGRLANTGLSRRHPETAIGFVLPGCRQILCLPCGRRLLLSQLPGSSRSSTIERGGYRFAFHLGLLQGTTGASHRGVIVVTASPGVICDYENEIHFQLDRGCFANHILTSLRCDLIAILSQY